MKRGLPIFSFFVGLAVCFLLASLCFSWVLNCSSPELMVNLARYSVLLGIFMWMSLFGFVMVLGLLIFHPSLQSKFFSMIMGQNFKSEVATPVRSAFLATLGLCLALSLMGLLQIDTLSCGKISKTYGSLVTVSGMQTMYWPSLRPLWRHMPEFSQNSYIFNHQKCVFIRGRVVSGRISLDFLAFALMGILIYRGYSFTGTRRALLL